MNIRWCWRGRGIGGVGSIGGCWMKKTKSALLYRFVYANFMVSVLLVIVVCGLNTLLGLSLIANPPVGLDEPSYRTIASRQLLNMLIFILTIFLFIVKYKEHEGHALAFLYGSFIAFILFIFYYADFDWGAKVWIQYFSFYVSASHMMYAFTNPIALFKGFSKNYDDD